MDTEKPLLTPMSSRDADELNLERPEKLLAEPETLQAPTSAPPQQDRSGADDLFMGDAAYHRAPKAAPKNLEVPAVILGTIARNSSAGVARLFSSLRDQKGSFELILVDNASRPEESAALQYLCESAPFIAHYQRREINSLAGARNDIYRASKSKYVGYLDSDVELPAGWLEHALRRLDETPWAAGISGPARIPTELSSWANLLKNLSGSYFMNLGSPQAISQSEQGRLDHLPCSAALFKRDALKSVGAFDESFAGGGEDLDLGLRLTKKDALFLFEDELLFLHATRAQNLGTWLERCVSLARGRVHVARKHRKQFFAPSLLLPLIYGAMAVFTALLLLASPRWGFALVALYLLPVLDLSLRKTGRSFFQSLILIVGTHGAYAYGEWAELLRPQRSKGKQKADDEFQIRKDAFSHGQMISKLHLCELLQRAYVDGTRFNRIYVLAGWAGLLPFLLRNQYNDLFEKIILVDLDMKACQQARIVNNTLECEGRFEIRCNDLEKFDFKEERLTSRDLVVNTSMEHFQTADWLQNIPAGVQVALQASDLPHEEHLSPMGDVGSLVAALHESGITLTERAQDVQEIVYPNLRYRRVTLIGTMRGLN